MRIGYARVSTLDQNHQLQLDALRAAGCEKIFVETASGAQRDRLELAAALDYARDGDSICVWRLDRLGRSLKQLIETVEGLEAKGIGFLSLTENIDTTTPGGRLIFHVFGALAQFERELIRCGSIVPVAVCYFSRWSVDQPRQSASFCRYHHFGKRVVLVSVCDQL